MDFSELEAAEGLRWPWNAWPSSRSDAAALVVPLSVIYTPLMPLPDLPLLPYEPLSCSRCCATLNPYARVDYRSALWICPFCHDKNPFPRSHAGIADHNVPAELFPTHSTVEYLLPNKNPNPFTSPSSVLNSSFSSNTLFTSSTSSLLPSPVSAPPPMAVSAPTPAFVFVVDVCSPEEELRALKNEILHVVANLPENSLVGLVSFGSMVWVHDLGYTECSRVVLFSGDRELSSVKVDAQIFFRFLPWDNVELPVDPYAPSIGRYGMCLAASGREGEISKAFDEMKVEPRRVAGTRPGLSGGAAVAAVVDLLGAFLPASSFARICVVTIDLGTLDKGISVKRTRALTIRNHQSSSNEVEELHDSRTNFYQKLAQKLLERSLVFDLFACSLDQVGAAEMRFPIETSGGLLILAESFESEQFKKCLRHIFKHEETDRLDMKFDATIELVTTKEVKICGALGPCLSLRNQNSLVSEKEVGQGGTSSWKTSTLTSKTSIGFIFQVGGNLANEPGPVFFVQFKTRYRHGDGSIRLRATTASRRWVDRLRPQDVRTGFDQEAAATIMARVGVSRAEDYHARDVIRWLDKMLIRFTAKFGEYAPEHPSSFRLLPGFSLYPQFMYHLRRSQFIDILNYSPDETAFFRVALNREGVNGSLVMIQPALLRYGFDGPPSPALLDTSSVTPDVILLFDSYFHVVIHYGSKIAQWRKLGFDKDQRNENLWKLLEAAEMDAEELIEGRIPAPRLIRCDQHSSPGEVYAREVKPIGEHRRHAMWMDRSGYLTESLSSIVFYLHLQPLHLQSPNAMENAPSLQTHEERIKKRKEEPEEAHSRVDSGRRDG
ncbi:hypothetical protein KSP39_PZI019634 [Platanthera zijinensis]|uniref:Protein transport protein SEC23 n=1 Tax=Platanthera zijinensis TaxID=2320716 RepID=A0AAP0B2G0_9ASPA